MTILAFSKVSTQIIQSYSTQTSSKLHLSIGIYKTLYCSGFKIKIKITCNSLIIIPGIVSNINLIYHTINNVLFTLMSSYHCIILYYLTLQYDVFYIVCNKVNLINLYHF